MVIKCEPKNCVIITVWQLYTVAALHVYHDKTKQELGVKVQHYDQSL